MNSWGLVPAAVPLISSDCPPGCQFHPVLGAGFVSWPEALGQGHCKASPRLTPTRCAVPGTGAAVTLCAPKMRMMTAEIYYLALLRTRPLWLRAAACSQAHSGVREGQGTRRCEQFGCQSEKSPEALLPITVRAPPGVSAARFACKPPSAEAAQQERDSADLATRGRAAGPFRQRRAES